MKILLFSTLIYLCVSLNITIYSQDNPNAVGLQNHEANLTFITPIATYSTDLAKKYSKDQYYSNLILASCQSIKKRDTLK